MADKALNTETQDSGDWTGKLLTGVVMLLAVAGIVGGMLDIFIQPAGAQSPTGSTGSTTSGGGTGLTPGAGYGLIDFEGNASANILIDGSIAVGQIPVSVEVSAGAHTWTAIDPATGATQSGSFLSVDGQAQTITINF